MKSLLLILIMTGSLLAADSNEPMVKWTGSEFIADGTAPMPHTPDGERLINPWTNSAKLLPANAKPHGAWQSFLYQCGVRPDQLVRECVAAAYLTAFTITHPPQ